MRVLQITIPERDFFDDSKQEFIKVKKQTLTLEHSLISISKWESKWKKPFLSSNDRTKEESLDYIKCMSIGPIADENVLHCLSNSEYKQIADYINDNCTATWFNERNNKRKIGSGQTVTSELIYYWMIAYDIPSEYQKWHLNRLLTLIRICDNKNSPSKKMKKKDIFAQNRALNEARKKKLGTRG